MFHPQTEGREKSPKKIRYNSSSTLSREAVMSVFIFFRAIITGLQGSLQ